MKRICAPIDNFLSEIFLTLWLHDCAIIDAISKLPRLFVFALFIVPKFVLGLIASVAFLLLVMMATPDQRYVVHQIDESQQAENVLKVTDKIWRWVFKF